MNIKGLNGFIKLHRRLLEWGWYQDSAVKAVYLHLLLTAAFKEGEWMGEKVERGQVITGMQKLADELGLSRQQVRTAINKLKKTNEITTKSTNKYTVVTIKKWEEYQNGEESTEGEEPTQNHQKTIKEPHLNKDNNKENVNNEKNINSGLLDGKVIIKFPLKDGSEYFVTEKMVRLWQEIYKNIDVFRELKKMLLWTEANPDKKKTKKTIMRFINGWLSRPKPTVAAVAKEETEASGMYDDLEMLTRKRQAEES